MALDREHSRTDLDSLYPKRYSLLVYQLQSTEIFDEWLRKLQDRKGRARILARLESAQLDKSTQARDIAKADISCEISARSKAMPKVKPFDTSAFLDDEEVVAEYLTAALEDANPDVFLAAVGQVAKARGMSAVAESTGLGRESLYKALTPGAKPRYDTVLRVLQGLGVKLTVTAA